MRLPDTFLPMEWGFFLFFRDSSVIRRRHAVNIAEDAEACLYFGTARKAHFHEMRLYFPTVRLLFPRLAVPLQRKKQEYYKRVKYNKIIRI